MAGSTNIEDLIHGARGRMIGALVRLDGPRTISEVARVAHVSRDQAATIVADLERVGIVERQQVGRAHLVTLVDEHPVTQSLREIDRSRERAIEELRRTAGEIEPSPVFMAIYGSWARGEATADSDLDVAVIAPDDDQDTFREALERWVRHAKRVTGRNPSLLVAEGPADARGRLWSAVRRDAIALVDPTGGGHGS